MSASRRRPLAAALLSAFLVILPAGSAQTAPDVVAAAPQVSSLNVTTVVHAGGTLRMAGPRQWIEEGSNGGRAFTFAEERRDAASVFLFDTERDMRLQLDLQQRRILFSAGGAPFRPLYAITAASAGASAGGAPPPPTATPQAAPAAAPPPATAAAPPPAAARSSAGPVDGLNVKTVIHAAGTFRMEANRDWVEESDTGTKFYYVEQKRDASSVLLLDAGRKVQLLLDLKQRQISYSQGAAKFQSLYAITGASSTVTPALTAEQKCANTVQGKVAWNRQGSKTWRPEDVQRFCATTTQIASAIECFGKEIQSHGDGQRAIQSCTENRHQVQVVYVIPKGEQARPDAEKALAAVMAVIQRHYFQQLGVTFALKTPLVSVLPINETVADLKQKQSAIYERANALAKAEFKRDYEYKENVIVAVFEGLYIGASYGGGNVASIDSGFWKPAYEMFQRAPSDLPKATNLHAWPHELGHAFGLEHTADAQKCFDRYDVALGPLPSLIMQKKETHGSVYEYPFMPQEKRLLLEENYYPPCRPLIGSRPHASRHLRHPLPPEANTN